MVCPTALTSSPGSTGFLDIVSRPSYRQERIIESQKQIIARERARAQ
jgi:hypothetical protein